MSEVIIECKHLRKSYDESVFAVHDFNLQVERGEFVTLLGPSGCGKTTILRMIAGFETPSGGEILLEGKDISALPPYERKINTVFQSYALFPHLNIYENIAFGLRERKVPKAVIDEKVKRVLDVVDLEGFEKRKVQSLSGGQQQRIAIARAIVNEPDILLLDEPMGALDYKMRVEMQEELKRLHKELGITFIFVTHDREEAMYMSDKIVVMQKGLKMQEGTPEEVYNRPQNAFVADFVGDSNIFEGKVVSKNVVNFADRDYECETEFPEGALVDVMIRPENVLIKDGKDATVTSSNFKGRFFEVALESGKKEIYAASKSAYDEGTEVSFEFVKEGIHTMKSDIIMNRFANKETGEEITFTPAEADLSDDPDAGIIKGYITFIIYKGDHYNYHVEAEDHTEYSVNDEYLWNAGDFVSIIIKKNNGGEN